MEKIVSIPLIDNVKEVKKFARNNAITKAFIGLVAVLTVFVSLYIVCYFLIEDWNLLEDGNLILGSFLTIGWTLFLYFGTYKRSCQITKYIKKIELRAKRLIIVANANLEYEYNNIICIVKKKDCFIIKVKNANHIIPLCAVGLNNYLKIEEKLKYFNVPVK